MKHLFHRQHLFFASKLPRYTPVGQYDVDRGAHVEAKVRRYKDEAVAESARNLGNAAIFRAEHVNGLFRVLELSQACSSRVDLHTYRGYVLGEQIKRSIGPGPSHVFVAFHTFFPGKAREPIELYTDPSPY